MLEGCWGVTEPKRPTSKLLKPQVSHGESGILLGLQCHLDLPESAFEIHCGKLRGARHTFQCFLDQWQRILVLLCVCIKSVKIHAEVQRSIFLSHQHHRVAPWGLTGAYCPSIQHIPKQGMHLLQKWWRYASELLLKWLSISDAYLMLDCTSTTKLVPFQHENVVKG